MRVIATVFALATISGCSLPNDPTVYIDNSFSPEMSQGILQAQTIWEKKISTLHFKPLFVSHQEAMRFGSFRPNDSLVFIRVSGHGENNSECTCGDAAQTFYSPAAHYSLAVTNVSDIASGVVTCVWQDIITDYHKTYINVFSAEMVHEIGHAYKMHHDAEDNQRSVMYPFPWGMAPEPTCRDLTVFVGLHADWAPNIGKCSDGTQ